MQYGMFYMHRCEQSGGQESVFERVGLEYILLPTQTHTYALHWLVLYNCITMHGTIKHFKIKLNITLHNFIQLF
jgi:hypothetical protein